MNAHPYDPATVTADRRPSDDHPRHYRAAIVATYHGPGARGATWRATLRRSPNDRPASATVPAQDGPDAAVAALLLKLDLPWRMLPAAGSPDGAGRYVYVAELVPGEGQALAAGPRAVWALAAAAELEAITAGADAIDPADPLALPLAMARVATGTERPRPIVAGWAMGSALTPGGVHLTDVLGAPIEGLNFSGEISAAVAQALAARGGCPAVIATLSAKGAAL